MKRLKYLLSDAYDEITTEDYEFAKELMLDDYESKIYQTGYIDGLKAAIMVATENDSTSSYTIEMEDIFDNE